MIDDEVPSRFVAQDGEFHFPPEGFDPAELTGVSAVAVARSEEAWDRDTAFAHRRAGLAHHMAAQATGVIPMVKAWHISESGMHYQRAEILGPESDEVDMTEL
jgi:hypothetical protein